MLSITGYLDDLRAAGRSAATVRLRGYQLADFARWIGTERCVIDAGRADIAPWLAQPMSAETRASKRAALSGFFDWLIDTGQRQAGSPFRGVPSVARPVGIPRPAPDWVVADALAAADPLTRRAIILGRFAGLRAAEIAAVAVEDVTIDLRLRVRGKGAKERVLPIHPQVGEVLAQVPAGWVFPSVFGGHWRAGTLTKHISAVMPGQWTAHSLRHAFATEVYRESGHDLRLVQQLLGHTSPRTTARYVLVDDDRARAVVAGLSLVQ